MGLEDSQCEDKSRSILVVLKKGGIIMKMLEEYREPWDYFSERKDFALNKNTFPIAFFEIIGLMAEDANYNLLACYADKNRMFIEGKIGEEKNELMLRYNCERDNRLVVARIRFIHRRAGKMTELYRILKIIQQKYHTGKIEIESVQTDEMEAWCIKNGFREIEQKEGCYIEIDMDNRE